jgi:hypothetical protein
MRGNPFDDLPRTAASHFKLYFFAAVSHVIQELLLCPEVNEESVAKFSFLRGYLEEITDREPDGLSASETSDWWRTTLVDWEESVQVHLPLRALRETCELNHEAMTLLMCAGLIEDDSRFGLLFEEVQGTPGQRRPSIGLLSVWWRASETYDGAGTSLRRLHELGLIQFGNSDAPRSEWSPETPLILWDVLHGEARVRIAKEIAYRPPESWSTYDQMVVSAEIRKQLMAIPKVLASGEARALVVRGPQHNGRTTLLRAVARELGRGVIEIEDKSKNDDQNSRLIGPLATALNAFPVIVLDVPPGETAELQELVGYRGAFGIVLGKQGGISGPAAERAITIELGMPDAPARRIHWQRSVESNCGSCSTDEATTIGELETISERFRMTSGNIIRAAGLAASYAALDSRKTITLVDVQKASRALNRQALDTVAAHVNAVGNWSHLAVAEDTRRELQNLVSRCRYRERLHENVGEVLGSQLNPGVRALFNGASGTGKTLAARLLAASLQKDLYRLDLSMVVNKYIGETEKNLSKIFALAEELDVILLLDEGDALLTQRTEVNNANDRYANLETNYLLQRLESFEGILVVTTNASERIDAAFKRRMDVVIGFRPPAAFERWAIWQMHLPADHRVQSTLLDEISQRCELNGGQIRNAVLYASSLALDDDTTAGVVKTPHLETAVRNEYRKTGAVCPLRDSTSVASIDRW